jgi:LysR family nitrogen assimilation transcriptional regulator
MDLKQLKAFAALAEFGSFSRAAGTLSIGQPVLSRQIKALEQELGIELVYRNGRGVVVTEAGKLLHDYAKSILDTVARARAEVEAMRSSPCGTLVLGMPPSVGHVLTVPLVESFRAQYPLMSMRVIEGFSGHVLEWLLTGKIDVAVLYNAPRMSNLRAEPLLQDELYLLGSRERHDAPAQGPVAAAVLAQVPLIMPSRPHGLRLLVDCKLSQAGITPRVELEIDAMPSTLSLVERGMGYTILSNSTVHHLVKAGRIDSWQIVEPVLTRKLILATSSQRPTTAAMRALVGLVRTQIRDLVRRGVWIPCRQLARVA